MPSVRRTLLAVLCALAVATSGCVYYNTFYHAREAYSEAEDLQKERAPESEPGPTERDLWERAVEKSGRVLRLHGDSKWADDALILLGKALYNQGKLESAEEHLSRFLAEYPNSEFVNEARYYLAAVMLARDNPTRAEELLQDVAMADPPHDLSDDAFVLIGRARNARGRYDEAAVTYLSALERFPDGDTRATTRYLAAENYEEMGLLTEAALHYAAVAGEKGARKLAFEARIRLADIDLQMGDSDSALEVLSDLERRTTDRDDLDRILLARGKTLDARGDYDGAISTYEGVAVSHGRSVAAAEARYRIGVILRDRLGRHDDAAISFQHAKDEAPRSDVARAATDAMQDIERLREYLAAIEAWELASERAESASDTSSADISAAPVTPQPGTTAVSPADTPAAAWSDTAGVVTADTLAAAWSDTAGVVTADTLALPEPTRLERLRADAMDARFRLAELYLFRLASPERALEYYREVIDEHPGTPEAMKAELAVAWVLETEMDDSVAAEAAYQALIDRHPDTDFAAAAEEALQRIRGETGER